MIKYNCTSAVCSNDDFHWQILLYHNDHAFTTIVYSSWVIITVSNMICDICHLVDWCCTVGSGYVL